MIPPLTSYDLPDVEAAAEIIRKYCGWHIAPSFEQTVTVRGSWSPVLMLPSLLVDDTQPVAVVDDGETVDPADYVVWPNGYLEKRYGCWGRFKISVTFTHGYEFCPADLAAVIQSLASNGITPQKATSQTRGPFSISGMTTGAMAGVAGIGEFESARLAPYRIPPRP